MVFTGFMALILIGAVQPVQGQTQAEEYRVKAAFLFHFAQLVDWPPEALGVGKRPLILCTVGEDLVPGTLESTMEGKQIGTRSVKVQHLQESDDLHACHVVFIVARDKKRVASILVGLKNAAVLTVGDIEDFTQMGGMIGFCLQEKKVRFEINLKAAQSANLKISSRLLLLAKSVIGDSRQG